MVRLISTPIRTDDELRLITSRLDEERIPFEVGEGNVLYVKDEKTRAHANAVLLREDLIPKGTDPWSVFTIDRFTVTDFERNVNLRRAIIQEVPTPYREPGRRGQGQRGNRDPREGALHPGPESGDGQRHPLSQAGKRHHDQSEEAGGRPEDHPVRRSGAGAENIVITDQNGVVLNDFSSMADFDRLETDQARTAAHPEAGDPVPRGGAQGAPADLYRGPRPRPEHQDRHGHEQEVRVRRRNSSPSRSSPTIPSRPTTIRRSSPR